MWQVLSFGYMHGTQMTAVLGKTIGLEVHFDAYIKPSNMCGSDSLAELGKHPPEAH